jgi:hypothetical protein
MLLVVLAATGIAVAASTGSTALSPSSYEAGAKAVLPTVASPQQVAALSVLGRPQTAADTVPIQDLPSGPSFTGMVGANVNLARRAMTLTTGEAWIVPGDGTVCLITAPGGTACQGNPSVREGRLYAIGYSDEEPGVESIAGIVPNGVSSVRLDLAGGISDALTVHENVYMQPKVNGRINTISFDGPSGPVSLTGVSDGIGGEPAAAKAAHTSHPFSGAPLVTLRGGGVHLHRSR